MFASCVGKHDDVGQCFWQVWDIRCVCVLEVCWVFEVEVNRCAPYDGDAMVVVVSWWSCCDGNEVCP